jgi:signal peptidase I
MKTLSDGTPPEATEPPAEPETKPRNRVLRFLGTFPGLVVLAFVVALLIKGFLFQAFYIPSESMEPTLYGCHGCTGDRIIVDKVPYYFHDPRRGDIIVFSDPHPTAEPERGVIGGFFHWMFQGIGVQHPTNEDFVKRVIGLPGDTVWASGGSVFVNGTKLDEPYLTQPTQDFPHTNVPQGTLFVLGDNRRDSADSRFGLGFVPLGNVIGKAELIIWPPSRAGLLH